MFVKNNKQKRRQSKERARRRVENKKRKEAKKALLTGTSIAVNPEKIHSRSTMVQVPAYYEDKEFSCRDCRKREVWTARQQKWWYEVAGGDFDLTTAVRCRNCRRRERDRKTRARKIHLKGLSRKAARKSEGKNVEHW